MDISNREKFKEVFGFDGSSVCQVLPSKPYNPGSCGYSECKEGCPLRFFPRCPYWWSDPYAKRESVRGWCMYEPIVGDFPPENLCNKYATDCKGCRFWCPDEE